MKRLLHLFVLLVQNFSWKKNKFKIGGMRISALRITSTRSNLEFCLSTGIGNLHSRRQVFFLAATEGLSVKQEIVSLITINGLFVSQKVVFLMTILSADQI